MKVRLFAALREIAGASVLDVDAHDVGALLDDLTARFGPEFGRIMSAGAVVVNGEKVERDRALHPHEEVALLPPVSGGEGECFSGGMSHGHRHRFAQPGSGHLGSDPDRLGEEV